MVDLSKEFAVKLGAMVESSLINYKYYELWCDELIEILEEPPIWIIELANTKCLKDATKVIYDYAYSEPFIDFRLFNLNDFYVSCLYVKYKRRHISLATFLQLAGQYSDGNDCIVDCSYFYFLLNRLEDNEYCLKEELEESDDIHKKFLKHIAEVDDYFIYFTNYKDRYLKTRQ